MKSYKYPNGIFFAMLSLVFLFFFFRKKSYPLSSSIRVCVGAIFHFVSLVCKIDYLQYFTDQNKTI